MRLNATILSMQSTHFAFAFLGGLIPALFWLWFWLREDRERPEPLLLIAVAFIGGMMVVPIALPLQQLAMNSYNGFTLNFVWVIIEEFLKYGIALMIILWNRAVDEPIDVIIYMIAVALGFASLENALFIFNAMNDTSTATSLVTGKLRFMGPTLLHVLASGTVGVCVAFAYYSNNLTKVAAGLFGLCLAVILHALFNFFIMGRSGETILSVFLFVWMGIIVLMLIFEKIKILEVRHLSTNRT